MSPEAARIADLAREGKSAKQIHAMGVTKTEAAAVSHLARLRRTGVIPREAGKVTRGSGKLQAIAVSIKAGVPVADIAALLGKSKDYVWMMQSKCRKLGLLPPKTPDLLPPPARGGRSPEGLSRSVDTTEPGRAATLEPVASAPARATGEPFPQEAPPRAESSAGEGVPAVSDERTSLTTHSAGSAIQDPGPAAFPPIRSTSYRMGPRDRWQHSNRVRRQRGQPERTFEEFMAASAKRAMVAPAEVPRIAPPIKPNHGCCWPMWGHNERPSHRYCGAPKQPGFSYCRAHVEQAYQPNSSAAAMEAARRRGERVALEQSEHQFDQPRGRLTANSNLMTGGR